MITLYRLDTPGAYRIVWLLEELQLLYQIATPAESIQHTLVTACAQPSLQDGDCVVVGNAAMTEYLLSRYDRKGLKPPFASSAYQNYQQWMGVLETVLLPLLQQWSAAEKLANSRVPFFARSILKKTTQNVLSNPLLENIMAVLRQVEENLGQDRWICDSYFSAADIQLTYALEFASARGLIPQGDFPHCHDFLKTVLERPSYQLAQDKMTSIPVTKSVTDEGHDVEHAEEHA